MINPFRKIGLWAERKTAEVALSLLSTRLMSWTASASGLGTSSGKTINDDSALQITTAFACVRVIAETVGEVVLKVYERQPNGNAVEVDHNLGAVLIEQPNSDMTGMIFREAQATNLAARGNAYALIERNAVGEVVSLYPIPAKFVTPVRDASTDWKLAYKVRDRGLTEPLPAEKVWHWKGFGYDGLVGLSPIACAREALGLSLAGEEFNARLFANGLYPSIILKPQIGLKAEQLKLAQDRLETLHAGLLNAGRPYMLPPGTEVADGIFAPKDAQFLELRRFQISELCRLWRISPHMIADLERATNNNIEQLSAEFIMYTMMPYFRRIEEECRMLFRPADRKRFFVRFNAESLLRADASARASLYSILLQNGVFSRNEVRALENRNRSDVANMDEFTVQLNMTTVGALGKEQPVAELAPPKVEAGVDGDKGGWEELTRVAALLDRIAEQGGGEDVTAARRALRAIRQ